jgi:hypothetical protein
MTLSSRTPDISLHIERHSSLILGARVASRIVVWLFCAFLAAGLTGPLANAQQHDERAIKVAYVFNLTKYVEWPHGGKQLVVGFVGEGLMGEALEKMLNGKISGSMVIRVINSPGHDALEQCDIVYVAYSSPKNVRAALDRVRGKSVLTVGDTESFTKDGGMVGLVRSGEQVQLQVNLDAVQEAHLKISSRVLDLATIVYVAAGARN